ncbi:hypothetical protein GCM10010191_88380 [Actinomadura vinacea]|uniref:Uncharacterized protein n=1 Tax=Actinomadura vinacea TaxID=115336 RepID=A0ABP5XGN2_9ACTN
MTHGSPAAPETMRRLRFVPVRERLPLSQPVNLVFRPDGLIIVEISHRINTIDELCKVFTETGSKAMNDPVWSHKSARGFLSFDVIPVRRLPQPAVYHELNGPAIVQLRAELTVDEAIARLMPLFSAVINQHWTVNLPASRYAA